jgi:hypothetical protein
MNLKHLTDKALLEDTKKLASGERELSVKVLHHLKEIDRRKLFSDLGFTSLYDYCVRELGYSEGSAHRRISSARLLGELPMIESKIESVSLNMTNVATLVHFFKEENIKGAPEKAKIVSLVEGLSKRECELKLLELSERSIEIKKEAIWVTEDVIHLLREYRNIKGTSESWGELVYEAVCVALGELQKTKFKLVKNPRSLSISHSRLPSASVKREVFLRDKQCVKCGSKRSLQFDHKHPFALGGKSTPENIRLLCFNCNQRERIRQRL